MRASADYVIILWLDMSSMHQLADDLDIIDIVAIELAENNTTVAVWAIIPKRVWVTGYEACR